MTTSLANHVLFTDTSMSLNVSIASFQNASSSDLYLTLSLPESYGWGSVGIGSKMSDALMFIVYPSANGQNTTLSTRTASGHVMPTSVDDYDCREISDTVSSGGNMEASFVCYGLADSQRLSTSSTTTNWIYAVGPNRQIASDSEDATIMRHSSHGDFTVDMTITQNTASDTSASGTASATSNPTATGTTASPTASTTNPAAATIISTSSDYSVPDNYDSLVTAHATLLAGSFIFLFPLGIVLLYLTSVRIHYMWQVGTSVLCFIGMVIALVMSKSNGEFSKVNQAHQVVGLVTVCSLAVQIALGTAHHLHWKVKRAQTWKSLTHVTLGRVIGLLGLINGILGFQLSSSTTGAVAYGVTGAVVLVLLAVFIVLRKRRGRASLAGGRGNDAWMGNGEGGGINGGKGQGERIGMVEL